MKRRREEERVVCLRTETDDPLPQRQLWGGGLRNGKFKWRPISCAAVLIYHLSSIALAFTFCLTFLHNYSLVL